MKKIVSSPQDSQNFLWPKTKNPIIVAVHLLGKYSIFLLLGAMYVSNKLGIKSKAPFIIFATLFLINMGWLFLQQKLKVYKILGWVVILSAIWMILIELFPNVFTFTLWW